jgi:hypothetical protein
MTMKPYRNQAGEYLGAFESPPNPDAVLAESYPPDASFVFFPPLRSWIHNTKINFLTTCNSRLKHFHAINYKTELMSNLYPKRTYVFGMLINVKWYSDIEQTDLVINVDVVYNHDVLGLATDRETTRTWYRPNGEAHPDVKVTTKDYTLNPQDQLDEAIRRRTNNVRQTNLWLIGAVPSLTALDSNIADKTQAEILVDGQSFFAKHETAKNVYVDTGATSLEIAVRDETDPQYIWFDTDAAPLGITGVNDVRDYIIYQISNGQRNAAGNI